VTVVGSRQFAIVRFERGEAATRKRISLKFGTIDGRIITIE
jgi:hypothetical protein